MWWWKESEESRDERIGSRLIVERLADLVGYFRLPSVLVDQVGIDSVVRFVAFHLRASRLQVVFAREMSEPPLCYGGHVRFGVALSHLQFWLAFYDKR